MIGQRKLMPIKNYSMSKDIFLPNYPVITHEIKSLFNEI